MGIQEKAIAAGEVPARTVTMPLASNARAKMQGLSDGFVKLFCRPATGAVIGGVVVAPSASELILPVAMAVQNGLTVTQIASTFSVYPSLSGLADRGRPPADDPRRPGLAPDPEPDRVPRAGPGRPRPTAASSSTAITG